MIVLTELSSIVFITAKQSSLNKVVVIVTSATIIAKSAAEVKEVLTKATAL